MTMEYKEKYSLEEVQELVTWFKTIELPQSMQIDIATFCPDLKSTVDALCEQALSHHENPTFNYTMWQLYQIKEKLQS